MIILRMIYFANDSGSKIIDNKIDSETQDNKQAETKKMDELSDMNTLNSKDNEWADVIPDMQLTGLSLHLAMQSVLTDIDTNSPTLYINEDKKNIYPKLCIDDLLIKIKEYLNIDSDINIKYAKDLTTPIIINSIRSENEINNRYDKVKDNPDINKLQKVFGANINKESIKKIIE